MIIEHVTSATSPKPRGVRAKPARCSLWGGLKTTAAAVSSGTGTEPCSASLNCKVSCAGGRRGHVPADVQGLGAGHGVDAVHDDRTNRRCRGLRAERAPTSRAARSKRATTTRSTGRVTLSVTGSANIDEKWARAPGFRLSRRRRCFSGRGLRDVDSCSKGQRLYLLMDLFRRLNQARHWRLCGASTRACGYVVPPPRAAPRTGASAGCLTERQARLPRCFGQRLRVDRGGGPAIRVHDSNDDLGVGTSKTIPSISRPRSRIFTSSLECRIDSAYRPECIRLA